MTLHSIIVRFLAAMREEWNASSGTGASERVFYEVLAEQSKPEMRSEHESGGQESGNYQTSREGR